MTDLVPTDRQGLIRIYETRWLAARDESMAHVSMMMGAFLHVGIVVLLPFIGRQAYGDGVMIFDLTCIAGIIGWMLVYHRTRFTVAHGALVNVIFAMTGFAFMLWRYAIDIGGSYWIAVMSGLYLLLCNFTMFVMPFHGLPVALSACFFWVLGIVAVGGFTADTTRWLAFMGMSMVFAYLFHRAQVVQARRLGRLALDARLLLAPGQAVRAAATGNLEQAFAPMLRRCVCVSSDWRNYQVMAAAMPSATLAAVLDSYYSEIESQLAALVPKGNYVLDWIADELFVAFYADTEDDDDRLVDLAIGFARRLLLFKEEFYGEHHLPKSIDVGIAMGDALIGMMGPPGFRKAAALGPCVEAARRIQLTAKELRIDFGDRDRVVFGSPVFQEIRAMPGGNLEKVGSTYYYEPAA